jgi:two-component system cell cycle sensor histidine kinase/response regulator CckA
MTDEEALGPAQARIEELERELSTNKARRTLFDLSLDLMCVATVDGNLEEVNASWTALLGWTSEELCAVPFRAFIHPEDAPKTEEAVAMVVRDGAVAAFQNRYRHKDGSYRWLSWNAVFDASTKRIFAVARDVTEFITTRRALEASEAAYAQLFNGMLDGYSYHDMIFDDAGNPIDYRFRAVNPAFEEMTGLKATDLVGRRVLEVLPNTERHWIEVFGNVAKTGVPIRYENYSQAFDKWFEVLAFCPQPGQFACTFHDITARKKAEEERARLQSQVEHTQRLESLGVMAGGIAHDFNNLLTAIIGGIELAGARVQTDPGALADLKIAMTAAERAADLCNQMLAYAGRAEARKEHTDLNELIRDILPLAVPALSKKIRIVQDYAADPLPVVADRGQIRQIALNLIINAGDAIGDQDGTITVRTSTRRLSSGELTSFRGAKEAAPGPFVIIEVIDTGHGMTPETMQRIFDPFFTTKFAGHGLGLAATLGIVRVHGGGIQVESEPGKGTRFVVALPAAVGSAPVAARTAAPAERLGSGTILICDDEPNVRQVTSFIMKEWGFDVIEAGDGQEALECYKSQAGRIRAILLDMTMPKMSGLEFLPRLRALNDQVPIVLMSGYDEEQFAAKISDPHLIFLKKPFRRAELQAALHRVLSA